MLEMLKIKGNVQAEEKSHIVSSVEEKSGNKDEKRKSSVKKF